MANDKLYWVFICLLAYLVGCSKSHQASTTVSAEVDAGDSQTDAPENGASDSRAGGGKGTRNNGDEESGGTRSNGGISGTEFSSGNGGAAQGSGGSGGDVYYDRDDFEPYDEFTISSIPRPDCPQTPPTEGTACAEPGRYFLSRGVTNYSLQCGYGTSLRADCRQLYLCESDGTWLLVDSPYKYSCDVPPENACPETPTPGESCETVLSVTVIEVVCEYNGFTVCTCSYNQTYPSHPFERPLWQCFEPPSDSRCPPILPNVGEGCEVQALECVYNDPCIASGDAVFCRGGEWIRGYPICLE